METFTKLKKIAANPHFFKQRNTALHRINFNEIDLPIIELIKNISMLEYCFSLQSCYGHFLYKGQSDERNLKPLPATNNVITVDYRIAYIAFCIEDNPDGKTFLNHLAQMPMIDPAYVQFGCAEWFWKAQINSFVLQVEPERFQDKDRINIDYKEALYIEKIRNQFYKKLNEIVEKLVKNNFN